MKLWKFVFFLAACPACVSFLAAQHRNESGNEPGNDPADLPPSPLEAFAARPTAKVTLTKTVGTFDSSKSRATVAIVIVEDPDASPKILRGVRIDLAHKDAAPHCNWMYAAWQIMCRRPNAAVYIEEARLEAVRGTLMRGGAELRHMEFISEYDSTLPAFGLIVCGYDFPNRAGRE